MKRVTRIKKIRRLKKIKNVTVQLSIQISARIVAKYLWELLNLIF